MRDPLPLYDRHSAGFQGAAEPRVQPATARWAVAGGGPTTLGRLNPDVAVGPAVPIQPFPSLTLVGALLAEQGAQDAHSCPGRGSHGAVGAKGEPAELPVVGDAQEA